MHIVDIGAGPGGLAVALAEQLPDARVLTVDIDIAMATLAAARLARERIDDRVTSASATSPPSRWLMPRAILWPGHP